MLKWYKRLADGTIERSSSYGEGFNDNWRIERTEFEDGSYVSTVFLNLDHNHSPRGEPILFETLVFGGILDGEMWRYSTEEEAREGHRQVVDRIRQQG